jgi:integrase
VVRGFARYLSGFEPDTQVPPPRLVATTEVRPTPHIFTDAEITSLMTAAEQLTPSLWAATMTTVIGLMAATGLRPGEVYRLGRHDVDLDAGRLGVLHSKHGKSRQIPLHTTTVEALHRYVPVRDRTIPKPPGPGFFLTGDGGSLTSQVVTHCFGRLVKAARIEPTTGRSARLGDLRHTFAVRTLLSWHQAGVDTQRQLPVLSAFLGHNEPAHTYWYLQAVPELMALAASRLEDVWQVRS